MSDKNKEELEDRVAELEATVSKMLPSRRSVLKGTATAAGAGMLGFSAGNASAQASTEDGDGNVGTPDNPVDVFADGVNAGERDITEENVVEAFGSNGNLLESYSVADYADMGAAINQAVSDGAAKIIGPSVSQSFSTTIEVPAANAPVHMEFPPKAVYQFDGAGRAVYIRGGKNIIRGGQWNWTGTSGISSSVAAFELASDDGERCNDNKVHPTEIYEFHKGFYLRSGPAGGVNYNRLGAQANVSNKHGLYAHTAEAGETSQANRYDGWRVGDPSQTDSLNAFTFDADQTVITGWKLNASVESMNTVINAVGTEVTGGITAELYMENNTNKISDQNGVLDEVYITPLWNRHRVKDIYMNSRPLTTFWNIQDGTGSPSARYGENDPRFFWEFDGAEQFSLVRNSNGDYKIDCKDNQINAPAYLRQGVTSAPSDPAQDRWSMYVSDGSDGNSPGDFVFVYNDSGTIRTTTLTPS